MENKYDEGTMYAIGYKHPLSDDLKEGTSLMYDNSSGFILDFKLSNLRENEIEAFRSGTLSLDLSYIEKIIIFVLDIEGFINVDLAFTSNITALTSAKELKDVEDGTGIAFTMILTEGTTNIIKALRVFSLSNHFSKILISKMRDQFTADFDINQHSLNSDKVFNKYPTSKALKKQSIAHMKSTTNY